MRLTNTLKQARQQLRLTQADLASQVGLSRQGLNALEAGRAVPGTDVALRLAQVLGQRVEALFNLGANEPVPAVLAAGQRPQSGRVTLAQIDGRWVAHPLERIEPTAADAIVARGAARPLGPLAAARKRLVVMGCAPAMGVLASRLGDEAVAMAWVRGTSGAALNALARSEVHVAGIHLTDESSGEFNAPQVRARFPGQPMLLVNLATWEQGIVVAPGNPLRIKKVADLLRAKVRLVRREPDSGAEKLFARCVERAGGTAPASRRVARGHMEVAQQVAMGVADAGITIRAAALAFELPFIPLAEERFDLVIPQRLASDTRIERLVDTLAGRAFKRELGALGGYATEQSGKQLAIVR